MSGPTAMQRLLEAWGGRLTVDEAVSLGALHDMIAEAIRRAQKVPASIDRRCLALVVTKLEQAEHWALEARRIAADRPAPTMRAATEWSEEFEPDHPHD